MQPIRKRSFTCRLGTTICGVFQTRSGDSVYPEAASPWILENTISPDMLRERLGNEFRKKSDAYYVALLEKLGLS